MSDENYVSPYYTGGRKYIGNDKVDYKNKTNKEPFIEEVAEINPTVTLCKDIEKYRKMANMRKHNKEAMEKMNKRKNRIRSEVDNAAMWDYHDLYKKKKDTFKSGFKDRELNKVEFRFKTVRPLVTLEKIDRRVFMGKFKTEKTQGDKSESVPDDVIIKVRNVV